MADNPVPLRQRLEEIAGPLGCVINPMQEHKIEEMERLGRCACTPDGSRKCPCEYVAEEIEEYGACLCRVVVTQAYIKRQEYQERRKDAAAVQRSMEKRVYGKKGSAPEKPAEPGHDGPVEEVGP